MTFIDMFNVLFLPETETILGELRLPLLQPQMMVSHSALSC